MEYKILKSTDPSFLEEHVKSYLSTGWVLCGDLHIINLDPTDLGTCLFVQVVTRG